MVVMVEIDLDYGVTGVNHYIVVSMHLQNYNQQSFVVQLYEQILNSTVGILPFSCGCTLS